jgi:hypothetical protein
MHVSAMRPGALWRPRSPPLNCDPGFDLYSSFLELVKPQSQQPDAFGCNGLSIEAMLSSLSMKDLF